VTGDSTAPGTDYFARMERSALADLFDELGPEAPTLCDGWQTADLAAHLVIRENEPIAAAGIMVPALAQRTRVAMNRLLHHNGYAAVVDLFRKGPRRKFAPTRLPAVDKGANSVEFFVHHEDVRRAQPDWKPRVLPATAEALLWRRLSSAGRVMFRKSVVGVLLAWPDTATVRARKGEPTAVIEGQPGELTLYATGRQRVARVELRGPAAATEAISQTALGL
jgi:uncharacterized protein (TIGR03085 family)